MKLGHVLGILGAGALCVATGGLAAPAIGAALGGAMGLSGAAATAAGLAALGGGSLAAGGLGIAGGTALIQAVAGGIGIVASKIAFTAAEASQAKKENEELRQALRVTTIDNATKQKIILQLNLKIEELKKELAKEKAKSNRNDQVIQILQEQLDDLMKTLAVATAA